MTSLVINFPLEMCIEIEISEGRGRGNSRTYLEFHLFCTAAPIFRHKCTQKSEGKRVLQLSTDFTQSATDFLTLSLYLFHQQKGYYYRETLIEHKLTTLYPPNWDYRINQKRPSVGIQEWYLNCLCTCCYSSNTSSTHLYSTTFRVNHNKICVIKIDEETCIFSWIRTKKKHCIPECKRKRWKNIRRRGESFSTCLYRSVSKDR